MSHDVTDFELQVIERSRAIPVLVDFWASWCAPCRALGPVIEKLAAEAGSRWELAKVDTEALPEIATRYHVESIPNVKLFVNGEVADEFAGAQPEAQVRRWLERAIPSPRAAELAVALRHIAAGEPAPAAPILAAILAAEPGNRLARFALAEVQLRLAPETVPGLVAPLRDDAELGERADALATLARAAADPHATPALAAVGARLRATELDDAFEALVGIVSDRHSEDRDTARGIARAMIVLLGPGHPVVEKHIRAYSSALHA